MSSVLVGAFLLECRLDQAHIAGLEIHPFFKNKCKVVHVCHVSLPKV